MTKVTTETQRTQRLHREELGHSSPASEFQVLSPFERFAFRLVRRMNQGAWKRFWTWCQSTMGAGWIHLSTYNIMNVYGLEHVEAASRDRPLLLVANHRSFFDMYAVSTVLFRNTSWRKQLFFPVRGRFFYQSPLGLLVNLIMGWWSMYPPFFATGDHPIPEKRAFDKYSFGVLTDLARTGPGNIIGFHPEGTRSEERRVGKECRSRWAPYHRQRRIVTVLQGAKKKTHSA